MKICSSQADANKMYKSNCFKAWFYSRCCYSEATVLIHQPHSSPKGRNLGGLKSIRPVPLALTWPVSIRSDFSTRQLPTYRHSLHISLCRVKLAHYREYVCRPLGFPSFKKGLRKAPEMGEIKLGGRKDYRTTTESNFHSLSPAMVFSNFGSLSPLPPPVLLNKEETINPAHTFYVVPTVVHLKLSYITSGHVNVAHLSMNMLLLWCNVISL